MINRVLNKIGSYANSLYADFKDFLAPSTCLCCGGDSVSGNSLLCQECLYKLRAANPGIGQICPFCSRPAGVTANCTFCAEPNPMLLYYWGIYEAELQECLLHFKFHGAKTLGEYLTKLALENLSERLRSGSYELVVPVPLHSGRERQRYYNQSEVISSVVSEFLNIEHCTDFLIRSRNTHQQAKLDESRRWRNVAGAFALRSGTEAVSGMRILLIDDIVTTGATIYEASRPLKKAGAAQIDIFSLAYAK